MKEQKDSQSSLHGNRRQFLKTTAAASLGVALSKSTSSAQSSGGWISTDSFNRGDSLYHGEGWESINPGYWQIKDGTLRRRLSNVGDKARSTGFPYHYESHNRNGGKMPTDYDPSLPEGILWRRDWKLKGAYQVRMTGTLVADAAKSSEAESADWKMYQPGYAEIGIAFGGKSLFEGYNRARNGGVVSWNDSSQAQLKMRGKGGPLKRQQTDKLTEGDSFEINLKVTPTGSNKSRVEGSITIGKGKPSTLQIEAKTWQTQGYIGVQTKGLADFAIRSFDVHAPGQQAKEVGHTECYSCYPLGDTLKRKNGKWNLRFVSLFASDGEQAEVRVSADENANWAKVPAAGRAAIVNHEWRRNTATIEVALPGSPADQTFYYTVWKDGMNVTSDLRIGTAGSGPGTGFVGDVPSRGDYVGRLPQLRAPYKLAGLSCHAINSGLQQQSDAGLKILGGGDDWQIRDQPSVGSYKHLEGYNFQIMVWEDDVWYMELVLYPPSTDDAYKVVTNTICGPTSRWQMMRHWNIINPGDHDYGMDDIKGPEQLILRNKEGLGQDPEYLRRNFQIVHHLITGDEDVDGTINPKKWRAWKMPDRDFTLAIVDSRLWRSSQDTDIWIEQGWGEHESLYDRTDPTRTLLGEEQFAWLQQLIRTDAARQICLTGLNGLHTVWTGAKYKGANSPFKSDMNFHQRDRVTADYAGWVKAGTDRVIELLGEREGVVTVYGDVHNGCVMTNKDHRVIECSFGPIGRSGGRSVIPGFGPEMKDVDGRDLTVHALYHKEYSDPKLNGHAKGDPFYWNFLEMEFDPREKDGAIGLRIRNMIDAPDDNVRGGASLESTNSKTGRLHACSLPRIKTLPNADVRLVLAETGRPLRGTRSFADGSISVAGLSNAQPGQKILVNAFDGNKSHSQVVVAQKV